jgi:glycosyltransferase involved in cell wall biosynthesis
LNIAYFTPLPPSRTGIAEYSAGLLPELSSAGLQVDLFTAQSEVDAELFTRFAVCNYLERPELLKEVPGYDLAVYHMGNNLEFHEHIYAAALRHPGLVVLHDYVLHHLLVAIFLRRRKDRAAYLEEMKYCYGAAGKRLGEQAFTPPRKRVWESGDVIDYPLNDRLIKTSRGVVIHSRFIEERLRRHHPDAWLRRIDALVVGGEPVAAESGVRAELGLPDETLLLASFGFMTRMKRIPRVLEALAALQERLNVHYLLVGELIDPEIENTIERLGVGASVHTTGYVGEERYMALMQACDVCINLRFPTMGETSAVLCQCLSLGKPGIVTDVGWYAELPDDCVYKVKPDEREIPMLVSAVSELATRPDLRRAAGDRGRVYVSERHHKRRIVEAYLEAFRDLAG